MTVVRNANSIEITHKWWSGIAWFLLFFCVFWDGALLLFLITGASWAIIFHALAGIALTYYTLTLFLNSSKVKVNGRELTTEHGPLPSLLNDKNIPVGQIQQVYLKKAGTQKSGNKTRYQYALTAKLVNGSEEKLLPASTDADKLKEIENEIEGFLGIRDEEVKQKGILDLEDFERLKEKVPAFVRRGLDRLEEPASAKRSTQSPSPNPLSELLSTPGLAPRTLPASDGADRFPLYAQPTGTEVTWNGTAYTVFGSSQLDWMQEKQSDVQLQLDPVGGGERRFVYATFDGKHFDYFEERPLGPEEIATLGFDGLLTPLSFSNGNDKYYPRDAQTGKRYRGGRPEEVEQQLYFTVRSPAQFRAVRQPEGKWEVYVQEAIDGGGFQATR